MCCVEKMIVGNHRLALQGFAKPKSRLGFVTGKHFKVSYEVTNIGSQIFPGGVLRVVISWPNGQFVRSDFRIKALSPNEKIKTDPFITAPMAEGYGLFMGKIEASDNRPVVIESPPGRIRTPEESFYSIFSKTPEEIYTKWALIVAIIALIWTSVVETLNLLLAFGILKLIATDLFSLTNLFAPLIAAFAYFFLLSFWVHERKLQKRLSGLVLLGIFIGSLLVSAFVTILIAVTHYDQFFPYTVLLFAPVAEETSKLIGLLFVVFFFSKLHMTKSEIIRLGGGIGMGFGIFETFSYIVEGAGLQATVSRLMVSVPFHISSAMLIGFGFAKGYVSEQILILLLAIALHSLSNLLAVYNAFLQGIVFWILLSILLFFNSKSISPE